MDITLGETIKLLRARRGLSQEQLAKNAGVSRNALASLERDESNYTLRVLRSVADALGFTAEIRIYRPNTASTVTAAPGDFAAPQADLTQPQVNPDR